MNFKLYGYGHWKWYDQVKINNVIVIIPPRVLKELAFPGYTSCVLGAGSKNMIGSQKNCNWMCHWSCCFEDFFGHHQLLTLVSQAQCHKQSQSAGFWSQGQAPPESVSPGLTMSVSIIYITQSPRVLSPKSVCLLETQSLNGNVCSLLCMHIYIYYIWHALLIK